MDRNPDHPSPVRYFGVGLLVVLFAALITYTLEDHPGLSQLVNLNLDSLLLSEQAAPKDGVYVVWITDDDYQDEFDSKSPLNQDTVQQLIDAIAKSGASVIGVDLYTDEWNPGNLKPLPPQPVVWAREAGAKGKQKVRGGNGTGIDFGCPVYIPDPDGVIRRYKLNYAEASCPTLAARLAEEARVRNPGKYKRPETGRDEDKEGRLINFAGGSRAFKHMSINGLIEAAKQDTWRAHNPLQGQIVLLGGHFHAAQDRYVTPVGYLDGVDILAHAVYGELQGNDVREAKLWGSALDVVVGMALVTTAWMLRRPWQMYIVLVLCFVVVFLGSWLVFRMFNFFVSFVPVVAGVILHEVVDVRIEYGEAVRERDRLARELEEARSGGLVR